MGNHQTNILSLNTVFLTESSEFWEQATSANQARLVLNVAVCIIIV